MRLFRLKNNKKRRRKMTSTLEIIQRHAHIPRKERGRKLEIVVAENFPTLVKNIKMHVRNSTSFK